jgi:hypothetical protein
MRLLNYRVMRKLNLPRDLVKFIKQGTLEIEIAKGYADIERLNAVLDAWEVLNPELALAMPWAESRLAWKIAGRPKAEWYEVLMLTHGVLLLEAGEIHSNLLNTNTKLYRAKKKVKDLAAKATSAAKDAAGSSLESA